MHIDFDREQTLFVGANNSGKTSAMLALRYFLIERTAFSYRDVSVGNWHAINQLGETWERLCDDEDVKADDLLTLLPAIDVWLQVGDSEIHHVAHLLPTLDWTGGSLGVRMRLEPKDTRRLFTEYRLAREKARTTVAQAGEKNGGAGLSVWPENLLQFLDKRMRALVTVNSYVLDPEKRELPQNGVARRRDRREHASGFRIDLLDTILVDLK